MAPSRDRRPGFSRRAQYSLFLGYVLAIAGALVGAALLALSRYDPRAFGTLRSAVATVTTPASTALGSVERSVAGVPDAIGSFFHVRAENRRLSAEVRQANRLLHHARTLAYDNRRLTRLLAIRDARADVVIAARLVNSSASSTRRFATLDAGLWQGVREGQPVEGPDGLIGRVLEAGPASARVLLLIDAESAVPVRRSRDGLPAIVAGRGDGLLDIKPIAAGAAPFRPGDVFVTSGTGGIFGPGIPVARVVSVAGESGLGRPFADPSVLDVAIVSRAYLPAPPPLPAAQP